jgi:hypothetical protein
MSKSEDMNKNIKPEENVNITKDEIVEILKTIEGLKRKLLNKLKIK